MKFGKDHKIIDSTLRNTDQAIAYILFLESEQWRHLEDVEEITKRIDDIKKMWGLKGGVNGDNR